jgi:hypothetical protein
MRGDIVHRIYGVHAGRDKDSYFGTYRTVAEAEAEIVRLREWRGNEWEQQYHNRGFVIRQAAVETDFQIPELPKPRDKYVAVGTAKKNRPGAWNSTIVRIFRRGSTPSELVSICEFERNYSLLQTFEPFRKGGRDFALISRNYTKTAVLDLMSGQIVAEETESISGNGFCPVGFYVPDWWDLHDGSVIPGSPSWNDDEEWPGEPFGFVWGCFWGDDSSWKVQYLDLSGIADGSIKREDRFGYLELATTNYRPPCLNPTWEGSDKPSSPPPFISIERFEGHSKVTFAVEMQFDLGTGACREWKRTGSPLD